MAGVVKPWFNYGPWPNQRSVMVNNHRATDKCFLLDLSLALSNIQLILLTIYCSTYIYLSRWWYLSKLRTIFWSLSFVLSVCVSLPLSISFSLSLLWTVCPCCFYFIMNYTDKTCWCIATIMRTNIALLRSSSMIMFSHMNTCMFCYTFSLFFCMFTCLFGQKYDPYLS